VPPTLLSAKKKPAARFLTQSDATIHVGKLIERCDFSICIDFAILGLVPKSTGEVAEEGTHEEGAREAGAQCAPSELQWRTYSTRRTETKRARETTEEIAESTRETAAEARC